MLCERCKEENAVVLVDVPIDYQTSRRLCVCTDCWCHLEDPVALAKPKSAYAIMEQRHG